MKKILISYIWSISNIGDMAITPGLLALLKKYFPKNPLAALSMFPAGAEGYKVTANFFHKSYPDLEVSANPYLPASADFDPSNPLQPNVEIAAVKILSEAYGPDIMREYELGIISETQAEEINDFIINKLTAALIPVLEKENPSYIKTLKETALIIYNSGTVLNFGRGEPFAEDKIQDIPGCRVFWRIAFIRMLPLITADYFDIPFAVPAHSYDALDYPVNILIHKLLSKAVLIGTRDPDSRLNLEKCGLDIKKIKFRPDSTFFYPLRDRDGAEAFCRKHSLENKNFLCLIIRTSIQGYINVQREQYHMLVMRYFIELWTAKTGIKILLCPEVRREIKPMKELIFNRLSESARDKCVYMDNFWTTELAVSVYEKARIVVSMDMHSVILALSVGTPVLLPVFPEAGIKAAMLRSLGLEDWLFNIDHLSPRELFTAAENINNNFCYAEKMVKKAMDVINKLADNTMKILKKYV
ncbi:MAG: hypothetical protein A2096_10710 [Spirochaetes bacterium GWF1_41_5]|nr:MAG: hypothetical protein A2096_10710 [Spirochaetes bacterium GWF1_41_5]HBE04751.1 hypothetical protein [Spirochaetia bacterium]